MTSFQRDVIHPKKVRPRPAAGSLNPWAFQVWFISHSHSFQGAEKVFFMLREGRKGCPGMEVIGSMVILNGLFHLTKMVRINGLFHLLVKGIPWGHNPLILTFDPNFLGHPSTNHIYFTSKHDQRWTFTMAKIQRSASRTFSVDLSPALRSSRCFREIFAGTKRRVGMRFPTWWFQPPPQKKTSTQRFILIPTGISILHLVHVYGRCS